MPSAFFSTWMAETAGAGRDSERCSCLQPQLPSAQIVAANAALRHIIRMSMALRRLVPRLYRAAQGGHKLAGPPFSPDGRPGDEYRNRPMPRRRVRVLFL